MFDDDPWGETLSTPAEEPAETAEAPVIPITTKKGPMADNNTGDKIVVTLKGGSGYDAPWIVFHGANPAEVDQTIRDAFSAGLNETVRKAAEMFSPKPAVAAPQASAAPQAAAATPPGGAPTCPHGPRVHRTGNSAKGPWSAWFCAGGKDSGCSPLWGK